jgi:biotin carboxyl carrier protein
MPGSDGDSAGEVDFYSPMVEDDDVAVAVEDAASEVEDAPQGVSGTFMTALGAEHTPRVGVAHSRLKPVVRLGEEVEEGQLLVQISSLSNTCHRNSDEAGRELQA